MDNSSIICKLSDFLGVDLSRDLDKWWKKVGLWEPEDLKSLQKWFNGHYSSRGKPEKVDTHVELSEHDFWSELLPIFNKYYLNINNDFFI